MPLKILSFVKMSLCYFLIYKVNCEYRIGSINVCGLKNIIESLKFIVKYHFTTILILPYQPIIKTINSSSNIFPKANTTESNKQSIYVYFRNRKSGTTIGYELMLGPKTISQQNLY